MKEDKKKEKDQLLYSDIESPDEMEEEGENSGRVLYFRNSFFRPHKTAKQKLDPTIMKLVYNHACRKAGLPDAPNKEPRPKEQGQTLSERIEGPRKEERKGNRS